MRLFSFLIAILTGSRHLPGQGASRKPPVELTHAAIESREAVYKQTPQRAVKLHLFIPPRSEARKPARKACVVFYFGGGWKSGS